MAAPPDLQDEPLPLASPGSQWFGCRGEGEDEAAPPKGARPAQQDGEPAWGSEAGAGVVPPGELCSGPARSPPVAMETASTGKPGGHHDPANGGRDPGFWRVL
ncbi:Reticulon-1 [Microtus ochrogaster]|uniref:Reticulon-1 n=1 Tax=Microtus ochrogaster TaxID=79684 RepID=A0A8J6GTV6_MICOH|nr:Reticulon-1 [Microtus ochrogaster]